MRLWTGPAFRVISPPNFFFQAEVHFSGGTWVFKFFRRRNWSFLVFKKKKKLKKAYFEGEILCFVAKSIVRLSDRHFFYLPHNFEVSPSARLKKVRLVKKNFSVWEAKIPISRLAGKSRLFRILNSATVFRTFSLFLAETLLQQVNAFRYPQINLLTEKTFWLLISSIYQYWIFFLNQLRILPYWLKNPLETIKKSKISIFSWNRISGFFVFFFKPATKSFVRVSDNKLLFIQCRRYKKSTFNASLYKLLLLIQKFNYYYGIYLNI